MKLSAVKGEDNRKRRSMQQTTKGASNATKPDSRTSVSSSNERSENKGNNCLGKAARDIGHRRVPDPPDNTTGIIFIGFVNTKKLVLRLCGACYF